MPRHKFTLSEQLKGVQGALTNPNTPRQFVSSLRVRASKLRKQKLETQQKRSARKPRSASRPGLLDWLGL